MKKVILSAVLAAMVLSFTGCDSKPSDEVKTVDWYKEHEAERRAMIEECKKSPGEWNGNANCVNAIHAHRSGGIKPDPRTATDAKQFDKF